MNETKTKDFDADLIVVGGGLAGLTAGALAARANRSVIILEKTEHWGGRALTNVRNGIHFNLGPHALYCNGHAARLLKQLEVPFSGRYPNPGRGLLTDGKMSYAIPQGLGSLIFSRLLSPLEKWRLARFLARLPKLDTQQFDGMTLSDWVGQYAGDGGLAKLLGALFRVSTYVNDNNRMSAGAAQNQLKLALAGNVWYLDGGWQTLIDGLRKRAVEHGADVRTGDEVIAVTNEAEGVAVRLANGELLRSHAAILAIDPIAACKLLELAEESPLGRWAANAIPVRAASVDVALDRLPQPEHRFALGLDHPLYFSVHSAAAKLAPDGVAVLHVMKYLGSESTAATDVQSELESYLDRLQPGWKYHVVARRFLPNMIVGHGLPLAVEGGLAGRPVVTIPERPNIFLAGDWVGPRGWLADASAASAEEAALRALAAVAAVRTQRRLSHAGI